MPQRSPNLKGRGTPLAPPNRFERTALVDDYEQLAPGEEADERRVETLFLPDRSRSILTSNDSPDVPFRWSINPYRGCEHGCAYCYARPTHETLGMNAGLDFETRIMVKHDAPELLRAELAKPSWRGELIAISGVTDCYQPVERRYRLTRGLLEVLLEARQVCGIVTKNALVLRDLDLLAPMAELGVIHVNISLTTLDAELARRMEPRTSAPAARLRAIEALSQAGVPVRVLIAPVIPGLNDQEIPAVLQAAKEAGAGSAGYVLLRLPHAVKAVFQDWLTRNYPLAADRVLGLIRSARSGRLSDPGFGTRMRGQGPYAEQIQRTFEVFAKKHQLDRPLPKLNESQFRPPRPASGQLRLF